VYRIGSSHKKGEFSQWMVVSQRYVSRNMCLCMWAPTGTFNQDCIKSCRQSSSVCVCVY